MLFEYEGDRASHFVSAVDAAGFARWNYTIAEPADAAVLMTTAVWLPDDGSDHDRRPFSPGNVAVAGISHGTGIVVAGSHGDGEYSDAEEL